MQADSDFRLKTCASCYEYLFPNSSFIATGSYLWPKSLLSDSYMNLVDSSSNELFTNQSYNGRSSINSSSLVHMNNGLLLADVHSDVWRKKVCDTLTGDDCGRWKHCCQLAEDCCRQQLEAKSAAAVQREVQWINRSQYMTCPMTWDGYSCWSEAVAETTVSNVCPSFLPYASQSGI